MVEDFVLMGYSTASLGDRFPTFRGNQKIKGKVTPAHAVKACRGSGGVAPLVLNLGPGRTEFSASHHGHFTLGKELLYPLNRGLDGPQSRSGRC